MACALFGIVHKACPDSFTQEYRELCEEWQKRALLHIKKNVGYVPGTVLHSWHGRKLDKRASKLLLNSVPRPVQKRTGRLNVCPNLVARGTNV